MKKESSRPADPKIIELFPARVEPVTTGEAAEEQASLRLQAFPDGHIFLWTHHPTEKGKFVLFNAANEPVAVTQSAPIADLLCQAVRVLFHAVEESKRLNGNPKTDAGKKSPGVGTAIETNLPLPENNLPVMES